MISFLSFLRDARGDSDEDGGVGGGGGGLFLHRDEWEEDAPTKLRFRFGGSGGSRRGRKKKIYDEVSDGGEPSTIRR